MIQSRNDWKTKLSAEPLPVMRRSLTQVRDLLNSSSVNHTRLSEIISRDPGFSLHILLKLNQLPNPPKEAISKISVAVPLLGMGLIEQASHSLPVLEERLKGPPRRGMIDCYSRGVHAACYASAIGERRRDQEAGSLYTAALLHDIGEMALWSQSPDEMLTISRRIYQGEDRDRVAQELLGATFEALNLHMSERWNLPDLVKVSQCLSNSFEARPLTVMLAASLSRESSRGWQREATLDDEELLGDFLEMPKEQAIAWTHALAAETARQLSTLPIPLPAFRLICGNQAPKRQPDPVPESKPTYTPVRTVPPKQPPRQPVAEASANLKQTGNKLPQDSVGKIKNQTAKIAAATPPKRPGSSMQQVISLALDNMRQELGLQRTMFAMLNKEKTALTAILVSETESDSSLTRFSLDISPPNLFSLLMKKPQVVALTRNNFSKYAAAIPQSLASQINQKGCLAMSVFLRNKPIGLFYADNNTEEEISANQLNNFKAFCQRTIAKLT